jgi:hypothetical protein
VKVVGPFVLPHIWPEPTVIARRGLVPDLSTIACCSSFRISSHRKRLTTFQPYQGFGVLVWTCVVRGLVDGHLLA